MLDPAAERVGQQLFGDRRGNCSRLLEQQRAQAAQPFDIRAAHRRAAASTGLPASSIVRHPPMTSKFSSANPSGSITE